MADWRSEEFYKERRDELEKRVGPRRFKHSLGVSETAEALACVYGADKTAARVAGLLHDWDKGYDDPGILARADELGMDPAPFKRAGLLHDLGKAVDHEMEGSHVQLGVELARKYKEGAAVVHAIEAHHNDVEPRTIIACLVQAADAISAARPGARRENVENYIKRLQKLEEIANSFDGVEKCYAIQAGREIRILVKPEVVKDDQTVLVAREIAKKIESELDYPGQVKVHVVRESRAIEYAK